MIHFRQKTKMNLCLHLLTHSHMEAIQPPCTACAKPTVCMCLCLHVCDKLLFDSTAKRSQP